MFVDASALVAIIAGEPDKDDLVGRLGDHAERLWSPMSCWETVSSLRRSYGLPIEQARMEVEGAARIFALRLVPVGAPELALALDAYQIYGKGRHPARLNMGDCFAYACARTNGAKLLYKGDDFARTDMA